MSRIIGLDLGTSNTRIYRKGRGIVLREKTAVAIDSKKNKVVSVGNDAGDYIGREIDNIKSFTPIKDGVVAEYDVTTAMLGVFLYKASGRGFFNRPDVVISVTGSITEVEKLAVEKAALEAGAKGVAVVDSAVVCALGAGLPVEEARGNMIIDIGGGTTEVAVISLGGVVQSSSVRTGGDEFDEAIAAFLKRKYNLIVGQATAEDIKIKIGSVHPSVDKGETEVGGRDSVTGLPLQIKISSEKLREAFDEQLLHIVDCIKSTLEKLPPEISSDIYDYGITLCGGTALLGGICEYLSEKLGVEVKLADDPLDCCVSGMGKMLEICPDLASFGTNGKN